MKKTTISVFLLLGFVLFTFSGSSAHLRPDQNFAAVQVPLNQAGVLDYSPDGDVSEWANVPSIFWVTHDMMVETVRNIGDPDASTKIKPSRWLGRITRMKRAGNGKIVEVDFRCYPRKEIRLFT